MGGFKEGRGQCCFCSWNGSEVGFLGEEGRGGCEQRRSKEKEKEKGISEMGLLSNV